jgi:hypothetical protein
MDGWDLVALHEVVLHLQIAEDDRNRTGTTGSSNICQYFFLTEFAIFANIR